MLPPVALTPCLPTELLSYILSQTHPTTLLICTRRNIFLSSLLKGVSIPPPQFLSLHSPTPEEPSSSPADPAAAASKERDQDEMASLPILDPRHPLLIPTLEQLSRSRNVNLAFIPTVSHLRAYLAVFSAEETSPSPDAGQEADMNRMKVPLLIAYGVLEQHKGTSEWSTQGLGNSLAGLIEAGARTGRRVLVVEARSSEEGDGEREEDIPDDYRDGDLTEELEDGDEGEGEYGYRETGDMEHERYLVSARDIWHDKLPILNGSLRRAGADREYAGRTVEVGVVLKRWFRFQKGNWEDGRHV